MRRYFNNTHQYFIVIVCLLIMPIISYSEVPNGNYFSVGGGFAKELSTIDKTSFWNNTTGNIVVGFEQKNHSVVSFMQKLGIKSHNNSGVYSLFGFYQLLGRFYMGNDTVYFDLGLTAFTGGPINGYLGMEKNISYLPLTVGPHLGLGFNIPLTKTLTLAMDFYVQGFFFNLFTIDDVTPLGIDFTIKWAI